MEIWNKFNTSEIVENFILLDKVESVAYPGFSVVWSEAPATGAFFVI